MIIDASGFIASVTGAIRQAANLTGANFQYLLATAQVESNLNPNAQVSTSSARGLFQFIEQTWLGTLKEHGPALGYGPYADAITRLPSGGYAVTDQSMRDRIMNLRSDPSANALMAGAFTRDNAATLAARLGRDPTEGELYIAHFLGPAGAGRLISLAQSQPGTPAAQVFPGAARANPSIFYDRQGRARTANEVYGALIGRYATARSGPVNAVAALGGPPDPAAFAHAYAAKDSGPPAAADSGPVFHSLFSTGPRTQAVAPMVSALWTTPVDPPSQAGARPRGLFQDQAPDARSLFRSGA